ncbi:MAG TPA: GNAT family N-acetyltransferase [Bacteroidetes bacterium]|nr:GNAT family N-acetyltransferase [Bacteroidota bacterium]
MKISYREANEKDIPVIHRFIKELAKYEKLEHEVVASRESLRESLFGDRSYAEVVLAEVNGKEAGFVLFFHNYSTFLARPGIYIEDLYVRPEYRGKGLGKGLLRHIASLALERDCGRVEWWVLNWNPARKFYDSLGATAMNEWVVYRLTGDKLAELASGK